MPSITEKELRARVKSGAFSGAYLICGEDAYRKEAAVHLLQSAVGTGGFGGFGVHVFDGKDTNLDDIAETVETVPLTGGGVCVTVRDLPFDALSDGQVKKLKALPELVPPGGALIFWQTGELKKTSRCRSIIKLFDESGFVLECAKLSSGELAKLLIQGAKKRGAVMSGEAAAYLVQSVGTDLNLLLHELEKLCAAACGRPMQGLEGGTEITRESVDALCAKTLEATAFDLSRALLGGDMSRALGYLDVLFAQRAEPVMIMGALNTAFIDLYQVKLAQKSAYGVNELAVLFPAAYKGREFRLRNAQNRAAGIPLTRLRACLKYLHEADTLLKSSPAPARPLLERTVLSLGLALRTRR
ncbi:MAG: DNA polymerase III subunit delta [Oscillospiraceae bacterium]|jgi:DNA polymerase-3 subunit delta|nr:DNA polymerase III subunit delta [Oscillospiraceae bacterium]